ncbi:MAG: hypothetical protein QOD99_53 [Chthoniobacter sp.]|jgi:hypothetical protein|nr:hypothetical protein [Chthoniobacter sp.]
MATLKESLDALFEGLGAKDHDSALSALTSMKADAQAGAGMRSEQESLFKILGVTDHAGATGAINGLVSAEAERRALWSALGATDNAGATAAITKLKTDLSTAQANATIAQNERGALWSAAGGAADQATAVKNITDFEGRVTDAVVARAASAGLPAPVAKGAPAGEKSETRAETPRSRLGASFQEQISPK